MKNAARTGSGWKRWWPQATVAAYLSSRQASFKNWRYCTARPPRTFSTVREDSSGKQLALYLNQLLARAHNLIYMGRKSKPAGVWTFYKDTFPAIFRETLPDTVLAFVIFFAAGVISFLAAMADPMLIRHLIGPKMMDTIEHHEMWTQSIVSVKPMASSAIMTNNISVTLATFALGITAGIGTVWMMVLNGLLMGVISAACWREGMSLSLWSFVAAHGVLELPAIFIAGGAAWGLRAACFSPERCRGARRWCKPEREACGFCSVRSQCWSSPESSKPSFRRPI